MRKCTIRNFVEPILYIFCFFNVCNVWYCPLLHECVPYFWVYIFLTEMLMYIEQSNQSHIVANGSDACEMAHVLILFNFFICNNILFRTFDCMYRHCSSLTIKAGECYNVLCFLCPKNFLVEFCLNCYFFIA